jgi:hypothetical protein
MDVVVLSKRAERIEVVLGEGVHSVRCELTPTRNFSSPTREAWGARSFTERTCADVKADIERVNLVLRHRK